jgi:chondroitin 4-sulfotransferase 11
MGREKSSFHIVEAIKKEFVFIHIPKSAGLSMRAALGLPTYIGRGMHLTAEETFSRYPDARNLFSFAFVRNPWDRMVAMFHLGRDGFNCEAWNRFFDDPFQTQSEYVFDDQGNQLVEFIGRYENLESDFQHVCDRIGFRAMLPHLHKSKHTHYRDYYDGHTKHHIERLFHRDIAQFGYSF